MVPTVNMRFRGDPKTLLAVTETLSEDPKSKKVGGGAPPYFADNKGTVRVLLAGREAADFLKRFSDFFDFLFILYEFQ